MTSLAKHRPATRTLVLATGAVAVLLACANALLHGGWTGEGLGGATRITARFSFGIFILVWSASALAQLWPGHWRTWLRYRRRALGLSFAAAHGVHLVALLTGMLVFSRDSSIVSIVGGGFGYLVILVMALTSTDAAVKRLGRATWATLHAAGGYIVAGIFAFSYYGRLETNPVLAYSTLSLLGVALVLRAAAYRSRRAQIA
jgi:methionine sulfoxide reductase heme-binding subunit